MSRFDPLARSSAAPRGGAQLTSDQSRADRSFSLGGRALVGLGVGLLALASGCASTDSYGDQDPYRLAVLEGRLDEARVMAEEALAKNPGDATAQDQVRDMQVMPLLVRAMRLTFEDQPQEALDVLQQAQAIDPENPTVQVWIAKTRKHLAKTWLEIANSFSGDADLDQAEIALRRALLYVPDDSQALLDLERILVRSAYRKGLSVDYFYGGLSALNEERYRSADRDLGISVLYDEANADAARRRKDVHHQLALEALALAYDFEAEELFFAATNEFRAVLFHDPDNAEALQGVERLEREVKAELLLRSAEMMVLRGEFAEAGVELDKARELTLVQIARVDWFEGEIEAARWEAMYTRADAYYKDRRLEEAVALLDLLLEEVESYADARETRDAIADTIQQAATIYAEALAADDLSTSLDLLNQIQLVVWPEYRDVHERIAALTKKLAAENAPSGSE